MYVPEPLSGGLEVVWQKILAALKNPSVIYLQGRGGKEEELFSFLQQFSATQGLVFGRPWAEQLGVDHFQLGGSCSYAGVEWKMTYRLAELLGTDREVGQKKKKAWAHMKEIVL